MHFSSLIMIYPAKRIFHPLKVFHFDALLSF